MWELLSNTKKKCWKTWLFFSFIIVAFTVLQAFNRYLGEITLFGWLWVGINIFPGLMVLFVSNLLDRKTSRIISNEIHYLLWGGTFLYMVIVLITLFLEGIAVSHSLSIYEYRIQSFFWTVPIQGLLLLGFILIFYKKKDIFKSSEQSIKEVAQLQAQKWNARKKELKETCFDLISNGKLDDALSIAKKNFLKVAWAI